MYCLSTLINQVIIPLEQHILQAAEVAKFLSSKEVIARHNLGIAKISIALIYDLAKAKELLLKAVEAHHALKIDKNSTKKYLTLFFKLHKKWATEYFYVDEFYDSIREKFSSLFMKLYSHEEIRDMFVDEYDEIDELIKSTSTRPKITAAEYFTYNEITPDDIHQLRRVSIELDKLCHKYTSLNYEFLQFLVNFLHIFTKILNKSEEFKVIGREMHNFLNEIQNVKLAELEIQQRKFLCSIIKQLIADTRQWIDTVFINKSAMDIHYLDVAFLANLAQFEIMFDLQKQYDDMSFIKLCR
ncbi:MAG: hypothetical protein GXO40_04460 [Epsilonproteobacteria bacterium]|nr:hypothetical protein [Campylobacterota bacterium]